MNVPDQMALESLAAALGATLAQRGERLACAESCTGGWVAQCLTAIGGSSAWFERGFVTYSNEAKESMLGVPHETLVAQGAVSEATAATMALGTLANSRADWSLAVTGIAGPSGGSPEKPVGTVCFAWAGPNGVLTTETCHFQGDRQAIRAQSVAKALRGVSALLASAMA